MGRIITQHWRTGLLLAAIAGLLGAANWLWVGLQPREPNIAPYEALKAQAGDYQPGGSECSPAEIRRFPPDREGARKRDSCADQAERHRLEQNDLVQQTRSADAAEEVVRLTYNQSLILLAGTIVGGLTLVAAVAAAWYARHAAQAARAQIELADKTAQRQLRAYVHVQPTRVHWLEDGPAFTVPLENTGQTPVVSFRLGIADLLVIDYRKLGDLFVPPDSEMVFQQWASLGAGCKRVNAAYADNRGEFTAADFFKEPGRCLVLRGRVYYTDVFEREWITEFISRVDSNWAPTRKKMSFCDIHIRSYFPTGEA